MAEIKDLLPKLNRMRENSGMAPLKSWKASKEKLIEKIDDFTEQGITDTVPGANTAAEPKVDDPEVAKARPPEEPKKEPKEEAKVTKVKSGLGRGLQNEPYAKGCRKAIYDDRQKERAAQKAARAEEKKRNKVELSDEDKRFIKDEAKFRGKVDPKKDPEKAKRQADKIAAKQAKRKAEGRTVRRVGDDEITVADIARELGISPKIARAKLRRHEEKIAKLHSEGQDRWTFPKSAAKTIREILK